MNANKRKAQNSVMPYLQDYRFNSILVKSFFLISVLLILMNAVIMVAVSKKIFAITIDEVVDTSMQSLVKTKDRIDGAMNEAVSISGQLCLDADVMAFLLPDTKELLGRDLNVKVKDKIASFCNVFDYIDSIYVYSHKSKFVISNEGGGPLQDFEDLTWHKNLTEREYEPPRMISREKYETYPNLLSYIHPIRLTQMQFLGGIIINIDADKLEALLISDLPNSLDELIIADGRNNIIFSTNRQRLNKKIDTMQFFEHVDCSRDSGHAIYWEDGQQVLVETSRSDHFGWQYIVRIPLSEYDRNNAGIGSFYLWLCICCMLFSVIAALAISTYCYRPVRTILDLLKEPGLLEDVHSEKPEFRRDEASEIALNIVRNLYSSKQMQKEMKNYSDIINKAQLTALQAQISPHFLFNTLENIRWRAIADCKGDNDVAQIILKLSDLLRISMDNEQQIITIEQEISNTQLYIDILQSRYEDKIKVAWDVDDAVLNYPIVKVTLQPIIENAVYHGIKPLRKQGVIRISIFKKENSVIIQIRDNGIGLSAAMVGKINRNLQAKYVLQEDHIGIMNVNQRLKLLMGSEVNMKISSVPNAGTSVTYVIPIVPQTMTDGQQMQEGEDHDEDNG